MIPRDGCSGAGRLACALINTNLITLRASICSQLPPTFPSITTTTHGIWASFFSTFYVGRKHPGGISSPAGREGGRIREPTPRPAAATRSRFGASHCLIVFSEIGGVLPCTDSRSALIASLRLFSTVLRSMRRVNGFLMYVALDGGRRPVMDRVTIFDDLRFCMFVRWLL